MAGRGRIISLLAVLILIGYILYILISLLGVKTDEPEMAASLSAELRPLPVVIIDPGHGGIDGGAVGVNDITEKDVNLAISLVLRDMLVISGFEVVMTRESDVSIHDDNVKGIRKQKTSDLNNRLKIANSNPGAIFISIHQNIYGSSKSNGAQMFYGKRNQESRKLAEILQQRFASGLQPENSRKIKEAGRNLFLMYNAECTSVLIECGFLSNPADAGKLADPEYQSKVAFTVMISILEFLGLDSPDGAGMESSAFAIWR